ncbi:MAG: SDR family oxidoreductase [Bdellovibrionales bacterium]|nr:SDR family oxidoreductase [Bdellovibrionales bacterium]
MISPVIFVTGAGKGIGEACVKDLIRRSGTNLGFKPRLYLTSRTQADLNRLAADARGAGVDVGVLAADLGDAPTRAFEGCLKQFGRVDVCLHSAGVGVFKNFLELTREDVAFTMKTNVEASFLLLQAVYKQMRVQKGGMIQWITSVAAEKPFDQSAAYCMSKYAQQGLMEVMRLYGYQDGIRLIEVKPGAVHTPMWGDVPPEMSARMMAASDVAQAMIDAIFIPSRTTIEEITIRPLHGDIQSMD